MKRLYVCTQQKINIALLAQLPKGPCGAACLRVVGEQRSSGEEKKKHFFFGQKDKNAKRLKVPHAPQSKLPKNSSRLADS